MAIMVIMVIGETVEVTGDYVNSLSFLDRAMHCVTASAWLSIFCCCTIAA